MAADEVGKSINGFSTHPLPQPLLSLTSLLRPPSRWIIGPDAWSYDIGSSRIHHLIASGLNVNILILDTTPYSARNTIDPHRRKKDVGLYATNHGDVYVTSIAVYSSYSQVLQALVEVDKFNGPSAVLAYLPYITEDISALEILRETKLAVDVGYWPLYRWNPAKERMLAQTHGEVRSLCLILPQMERVCTDAMTDGSSQPQTCMSNLCGSKPAAQDKAWLPHALAGIELGDTGGLPPPSTFDWKGGVGCAGLVLGQPTIGPTHVAWTLERRIDVRRRGLSPTLSSPFSFHALSHGVFDRYDLMPASFPHDSPSEVRFGDKHSAFSDPDMSTTSNYRGFTHHSTCAGDLIFSNRSHQPQQHFEYGAGGTRLGLSAMHALNSYLLQVPGGHLQGIDDIGLNASTLRDSSIDLGYDANPGGVCEGGSPDHVPGSGYVSPHLIDPMDPIPAATAAGVSQHSTPPATPIMSSRTAQTVTIHGGNTAAQNRSLSVPPSES